MPITNSPSAMKTIKIKFLVTTILLALFSLSAISQEMVRFDVNGIDVAMDKYTKAQVIAKLGTPLKYISDDDDYESYRYANSRFEFMDNGMFVEFVIKDPQFKLFDGRVKVGDPLSAVQFLPGCRFSMKSKGNDSSYSDLWYCDWERPIHIRHTNGIITLISYSDPL